MKQVEDFINSIFDNVDERNQEIQDLKEEMRNHLIEAVNELKLEGKSEEEAIRTAIERFGDQKQIAGGLFRIFKAQKRFVKNLFRTSFLFLLIGIISLVWVGIVDENYHQEWSDISNDIFPIVQGKTKLSSEQITKIENRIESFNVKYDNLVYLAIFFEEEGISDDKSPVHYNLSEAVYVYPKNAEIRKDLGIAGGSLEEKWFIEIQLDDNYRDYFYLIPISSFIVFVVLFLVWLVSYSRTKVLLKGGEKI